jgi:hypothetical protein
VSQESPEDVDALRQELEQLRERMTVVKQEAAAEVDRKWASPFRTQDLFDLKVKARLSGNDEYNKLRSRIQEAEAKLAAESDVAGG